MGWLAAVAIGILVLVDWMFTFGAGGSYEETGRRGMMVLSAALHSVLALLGAIIVYYAWCAD